MFKSLKITTGASFVLLCARGNRVPVPVRLFIVHHAQTLAACVLFVSAPVDVLLRRALRVRDLARHVYDPIGAIFLLSLIHI